MGLSIITECIVNVLDCTINVARTIKSWMGLITAFRTCWWRIITCSRHIGCDFHYSNLQFHPRIGNGVVDVLGKFKTASISTIITKLQMKTFYLFSLFKIIFIFKEHRKRLHSEIDPFLLILATVCVRQYVALLLLTCFIVKLLIFQYIQHVTFTGKIKLPKTFKIF